MTKQLKASQMHIAALEASAEEAKKVHADAITDVANYRGTLTLRDQQLEAAQARVQELVEEATHAKEREAGYSEMDRANLELQDEVERLVTQVEVLQVPYRRPAAILLAMAGRSTSVSVC